jgi:hypothetical protein
MKKVAILLLIVSLLSSGCGTTQPERTGAIVGGAAIGNSVGGAIGGLVMAGEEATEVLPLEALSAHWLELLLVAH